MGRQSAPQPVNNMTKRFISIQYLRALSAIVVVFVHAEQFVNRYTVLGEWRVALFFVMSGFVLWRVTSRRETPALPFLLKRFARILPSYWLVTIAIVLMTILGMGRTHPYVAADVIRSLLLIPYGAGWHGEFMPLLVPGWTLPYELWFCCALAAGLLLPTRIRFWALSLVLGGLGLVGLLGHPAGAVTATLTGFPMIQLLTGIWIGRFWRPLPIPRIAGWVLMAAGVALSILLQIQSGHPNEFVGVAPRTLAPAVMVLIGALALEPGEARPIPWLSFLGDASFSIYIWHWPVLAVAGRLAAAAHLKAPEMAWPFFTTVLSVVFGSLMYIVLERRMTRALVVAVDRWIPKLGTPALLRRSGRTDAVVSEIP